MSSRADALRGEAIRVWALTARNLITARRNVFFVFELTFWPGVTPPADYVMMVLSIVLGGGSVLLLAVRGSSQLVHLGLSDPVLLLWDAILSLAFFLQHSGMVRKHFRARMAAYIPPRYHGAIYPSPLVSC